MSSSTSHGHQHVTEPLPLTPKLTSKHIRNLRPSIQPELGLCLGYADGCRILPREVSSWYTSSGHTQCPMSRWPAISGPAAEECGPQVALVISAYQNRQNGIKSRSKSSRHGDLGEHTGTTDPTFTMYRRGPVESLRGLPEPALLGRPDIRRVSSGLGRYSRTPSGPPS